MAAGLQNWSYETGDVPGSLRFFDENEKPLLLTGPTAAELASRIDTTKRNLEAAQVMGPQMVAKNRVQAAPGSRSVRIATDAVPPPVQAVSAAAPRKAFNAEVYDPAAPFADINLEPTRYAGAQAAAPPAAPVGAPPAAIARPTDTGGPQPLGFGLRRSPQGTIQKFGGGSRAVTSADIEKKAAGARALPTSQIVSTTGGFEPSEEYLKASLDNARKRSGLAGEIKENNDRSIKTEIADTANTQALRAQHAQEQQQLQNEIDKRVKEDEARAEQARKEYQGAKVDPNRIFAGEGGTVKALVYAVSAALGAFGATLGRTENFAQNMINGIIDRDINAQEAEIAVKRDNASNAMADLQRSGLSRDQSRTLLRQIQKDYVSSLTDKQRAEAKLDENDSNYKMLKLGLEKDTIEFLEKYRRDSLGSRTQQVNSNYAYEQAARAGGWYDVPDQIGTAKSLQSIRETDADIEKKQADAAKAKAAAVTGADEVDVRAYKEKVSQIEEGQSALERIAAMKGLAFNPRTGRYEGDTSGTWGTGILGSEADQAYGAQVDSLAPGIGRGLEGNAPNESTMDSIKSGLTSASGDKTREAINALNDRLMEKRRAADATVAPVVVQSINQRQQQVDQTNTASRTGVAPPPVGGAPLPAPTKL